MCPQVVENTYRKARELLEDHGVDLTDLAEMLETHDGELGHWGMDGEVR